MHNYMKTFVVLLGVSYFAGAQAQTSSSAVSNATSSVAASPTYQATVNTTQSHSATAITPVATPVVSSASQAGGQTMSAVSGGGAQSAVNSPASPAATSAGAGAGAGVNPSPSSAAANAAVSATTAVANPPVVKPSPSSAGAENQPASSSVKVTEAPKKPTVVKMDMKINKDWSADYNNQSSALYKNLSRDLYAALNSTLSSHGLVNLTILSVTKGSIIVKMELYFMVPSSTTTNIEEVIKKDKDNKLRSFGVDLNSLAIKYPEVKLGDWKPKSNECATKCCDGAGGSIALERTCEPSGSCGGISLKKTSSNSCTSYCKDACNSGTLVKASISTFILAALALIRTLA